MSVSLKWITWRGAARWTKWHVLVDGRPMCSAVLPPFPRSGGLPDRRFKNPGEYHPRSEEACKTCVAEVRKLGRKVFHVLHERI